MKYVKLCCGIGHIVVCFCFGEGECSPSIMDQTVSIPLEPEVAVLQVSDFFFNAVNDEVPTQIFI